MMATCPGCGLEMPRGDRVFDQGYNASHECWSVYAEVLGEEFANAVLFGRCHQLTVDAYAVQHAGGPHPDKSVCVHLVGLHLALECGIAPPRVPAYLQRLAAGVASWPHFELPAKRGELTVYDVAIAGSPEDHAQLSHAWAKEVWSAWSEHHAAVAQLTSRSHA